MVKIMGIRKQETSNQDLTGRHIAEETKREAEHAGQVAEDLQDAHEQTDKPENECSWGPSRSFP